MRSFSIEAKAQFEDIQSILQEMQTSYSNLGMYFAIDKQKYNIEEFMSDIKTFKDQFKVIASYIFSLFQLINLSEISILEKIRIY